jgi:hypothetical protein
LFVELAFRRIDTTVLLNGQYIGMDKRQLAVKTAAAELGL